MGSGVAPLLAASALAIPHICSTNSALVYHQHNAKTAQASKHYRIGAFYMFTRIFDLDATTI